MIEVWYIDEDGNKYLRGKFEDEDFDEAEEEVLHLRRCDAEAWIEEK